MATFAQRPGSVQAAAIVAVAALAGASASLAATADPADVLPSAVSYEAIGLNFAMYSVSSNSIGTLNDTNPGCAGVCQATTALGSDPSISLKVNEVPYEYTAGGISQADLGYYVEYVNAPGTYDVDLHALESISAPGGGDYVTHLKIGEAGDYPANFNNFAGTTFEEADCANVCQLDKYFYAPGVTPGPFVADHTIEMQANTLYYIQLDIVAENDASGVQDSAYIDPTFSAKGGSFLFSPGVTAPSAAPEPATWALLAAGVGVLGGALRRGRRGAATGARSFAG
jgi:hypothetical protein